MNHIDQDDLLKLVLGLLDTEDDRLKMQHIMQCPECLQGYLTMKSQKEMLGCFDPPIDPPTIPLPTAKWRRLSPLLKIAAILIVGFMTGILFSEITARDQVQVVQQTLVTRAEVSTAGYTPCQQVDTGVNTY